MPNENLIALIAALRSGRYNQTRGKLRDGDCHCALGVACDVADPKGWEQLDGYWSYEGLYGSTEDWVREHYGISFDLWDKLVDLNDCHRFTFEQIADYIEAHCNE